MKVLSVLVSYLSCNLQILAEELPRNIKQTPIETDPCHVDQCDRQGLQQSLLGPFVHARHKQLHAKYLRGSIHAGCSDTKKSKHVEGPNKEVNHHRILQHVNIFDVKDGREDHSKRKRKKVGRSRKRSKASKQGKSSKQVKSNKNSKTSKGKEQTNSQEKFTCSGSKHIKCNGNRIFVCHYRRGDLFRTICLEEDIVSDHLRNHRKDYCGKCEDKSTKTSPSMAPTTIITTPSTIESIPVCVGHEYMPCDSGYYVCLFDELQSDYKTVCSSDQSLKHSKHDKDYCGQCSLTGQFIHLSLVTSAEPLNGTEYVTSSSGELFETKFEAEFNDFGFISLAASQDLIINVHCSSVEDGKGMIAVVFKEVVSAGSIYEMFPNGSLIVVDGALFGSCDIAGEGNPWQLPSNGYLTIESVSSSGQEVTVAGIARSIHYFFKNLSLSYSIVERRKLVSIGEKFEKKFEIEGPKQSPIRLKGGIELSGFAFATVGNYKWNIQSGFTFDFEIGFLINLGLDLALIFGIPNKLPAMDLDFPKESGDWPRFQIYSIPATKSIEKFVNLFLPKAHKVDLSFGLFVAHPFNIMVEAEQKLDIELAGFKVAATTGEKHLVINMASSKTPSIGWKQNEAAGVSTKFTTINDTGVDTLDLSTKVTGFAGFKPQVLFTMFGHGRGSIGIRSGAFFDVEFPPQGTFDPRPDYPGLPAQFGECNKCHDMRFDLDVGVGKPFFEYKLPGFLPKEVNIGNLEIKKPVVEMCLLGYPCPGQGVTILIEPTNPIVIGNGGLPNTIYYFVLTAENVPGDIGSVRFEWNPTFSDGSSFFLAPVDVDQTSIHVIELSYPTAGIYKLAVSVYNGQQELAESSIIVNIGDTSFPMITVEPTNPIVISEGGMPNTAYEFILTAEDVPEDISEVRFEWDPDFSGGSDSIMAPVEGGQTSHVIELSYPAPGSFLLVVSIHDGPNLLAMSSIDVIIIDTTKPTAPTSNVWKELATGKARGDRFGSSVAIYENTVVVGAPSDFIWSPFAIPYVTVFSLGNNGSWIRQQLELPDGVGAKHHFGASVAIHGRIVAGAPRARLAQVYVPTESGAGWKKEQDGLIVAPDKEGNSNFGSAVAVHDDTVVIGAPSEKAAYVFVRTNSSWVFQQRLDGTGRDGFGSSVAIHGDTIIVGSPGDDFPTSNSGTAQAFVRNNDQWTPQGKRLFADGGIGHHNGYRVGIHENTAIIGSEFGKPAKVYVRDGDTWLDFGVDSLLEVPDNYGRYFSVAVYHNTAVLGTRNKDTVHAFVRSGNSWQRALDKPDMPPEVVPGDRFGASVAIHGNTVVAGAPWTSKEYGAVYVLNL